MKKFLFIFLICFFALLPNVYADLIIPTDIFASEEKLPPIRYNVNNLFWYGNNASTPTNKWAYQYDTSSYDKNLTYTISGAIFSSNSINNFYGTPVVSINGQFCTIQNTYELDKNVLEDWSYNNSPDVHVDYFNFYSTKTSSLSSFVCNDVKITSSSIEYLNLLFSYSADYVRITELSINTSNSSNIIKEQEETNQKIQEQIQEQQKTNQELGELNDNLTNSDSPDNMGGLSNSAGWLPAGPIDSIINLPLSMLNNISDNLSKSCQPVNLPLPFVNKDLPLPCLTSIYSQIDGLGPWVTTISVIASAFILFSYLIKLYKWVDDTLTFRENNYIDNWGGL